MKIFIILAMLLGSLYANNSFDRVLITKTTKKSQLKVIKRKLDTLNVKMFVQTIPSGYYVYSDKITNKSTANSMLRKIKTKFPYAKIVTIEPKAEVSKKDIENNEIQNVQDETTSDISVNDEVTQSDESSLFIGLGLGYTTTEASTNYAPASGLNNNGLGYMLEAGFNYNDNIFITLNYSDTSTDDIAMNHMYGSLNFNYNLFNDLDIFVGGIIGYSTLTIGANINSTESSTMLYGAQGGIRYDLTESIFMFTSYQALMADHIINLPVAGTKIEVSSLNYMQIGIGYKF